MAAKTDAEYSSWPSLYPGHEVWVIYSSLGASNVLRDVSPRLNVQKLDKPCRPDYNRPMRKNTESKALSRRDVLKLAGTAAAFCASFGFLHGEGEADPQIKRKPRRGQKTDQMRQHQIKWQKAQIKWYAGNKLLHTADFPSVVLKHLQNDLNAAVQIKWYRTGMLQQTMFKIEAKH